MATQAQIDANRQNAQHSTGPVTEAGRAAVSQNRTTHGLTGEFKTRTEAETAEYARLLESFAKITTPTPPRKSNWSAKWFSRSCAPTAPVNFKISPSI